MARSERVASSNTLLTALSGPIQQQLLASCELVDLEFADVLCEPGERIRNVYFPVNSFISLVTALEGEERLEVGIVGDEGMLGISLVLGVDVSPQHAMVQGAGTALRMSTAAFTRHCRHNASLRQRLNRYVYVLLAQLAQTAACTHYHAVEARLARWLLLTRDRAHSNDFQLTHEFLAYMLGVRRVGITEAASSLQRRGIIEYRRGKIVILNAAALEKASCHCYGDSKMMYEKTMANRRGTTRKR